MTITWHGKTCFKIVSGETSLVINPPEKALGLKRPSGGSIDILLFSEEAPPQKDWSGLLKDETIIVDTPGEFNVKDFFILSASPTDYGRPSFFVIEAEQKTICHLVSYPEKVISDTDLERIGNVDVLMLPVGGDNKEGGFGAEQAVRIINRIEPNVVIPMNYQIKESSQKIDEVDVFLKEFGANGIKPQNKYTLKKNDSFKDEETSTVLLEVAS